APSWTLVRSQLPAAQRPASLSLRRRFGRPSLSEVFRYLREFRITDPSLIACPSLALAGQDEGVEPLRQLEEFCATVDGPVRSRVFTAAEGAGAHCQVDNLPLMAAEVCDWLDEQEIGNTDRT